MSSKYKIGAIYYYRKCSFGTIVDYTASKHEIKCKIGIYFSFDFLWDSLQLDIVCFRIGEGERDWVKVTGKIC